MCVDAIRSGPSLAITVIYPQEASDNSDALDAHSNSRTDPATLLPTYPHAEWRSGRLVLTLRVGTRVATLGVALDTLGSANAEALDSNAQMHQATRPAIGAFVDDGRLHCESGALDRAQRGASRRAFPRGAWER
ncbi:MAG TPA: hypothetical protein VGM05_06080, partial [Planctomycetaceae bacterium]